MEVETTTGQLWVADANARRIKCSNPDCKCDPCTCTDCTGCCNCTQEDND